MKFKSCLSWGISHPSLSCRLFLTQHRPTSTHLNLRVIQKKIPRGMWMWTLVLERLAKTCVNYCKTKNFQKDSSLLLYCKSNPLRFVSGKQSLAFIMFSYKGSTAWKVSKNGFFPGPHFPVLELNMEIYYKFSPNTGKYGPEKTTYLDTSHAVQVLIFKFR